MMLTHAALDSVRTAILKTEFRNANSKEMNCPSFTLININHTFYLGRKEPHRFIIKNPNCKSEGL